MMLQLYYVLCSDNNMTLARVVDRFEDN